MSSACSHQPKNSNLSSVYAEKERFSARFCGRLKYYNHLAIIAPYYPQRRFNGGGGGSFFLQISYILGCLAVPSSWKRGWQADVVKKKKRISSLLGYTVLNFKIRLRLFQSSAVFSHFWCGASLQTSNKWLILCFGDAEAASVEQTAHSDIKAMRAAAFNTFVARVVVQKDYAEDEGFFSCKHINMFG